MLCETGRHDADKGWHLFGLGNVLLRNKLIVTRRDSTTF